MLGYIPSFSYYFAKLTLVWGVEPLHRLFVIEPYFVSLVPVLIFPTTFLNYSFPRFLLNAYQACLLSFITFVEA